VAFLAGGVNAVAGGGTLLVYPTLLMLGLPPVTANVTSTVSVWPGYLSSAAAYRDEHRTQRPLATALSVAATVGACAGTALLLVAPAHVFDVLVPFLVLTATGLLAAQPGITAWLNGRTAEPAARQRLLVVAVAVAAAYGAYFGGGLGIILLAALALCLQRALGELNGLKTLLALVANTVALLVFVVDGQVRWTYVLAMAPASLAGGIAGARFARRLDARVLRAVVVLFGTCAGLRLLLVS
jgi:uncharacterized membrane protein YfcA